MTPIVLPMAVAGLVGVVIATLGAFIHRRAIVAGSRAILIGLILSMPSVLGTLALGYGLWTANLLFGEKTARLGYEIVSLRRAAMLSRTWSVWFAGALILFGLGLLGSLHRQLVRLGLQLGVGGLHRRYRCGCRDRALLISSGYRGSLTPVALLQSGDPSVELRDESVDRIKLLLDLDPKGSIPQFVQFACRLTLLLDPGEVLQVVNAFAVPVNRVRSHDRYLSPTTYRW